MRNGGWELTDLLNPESEMINIKGFHHIAIICSNYQKSKAFYTGVLGFKVESENFRAERRSYKCDLSLNGKYVIELFSFESPPPRLTGPEATGLRHIAFEVNDLDAAIEKLESGNIFYEPARIDEYTGKRFTFIFDPDALPVELYEVK